MCIFLRFPLQAINEKSYISTLNQAFLISTTIKPTDILPKREIYLLNKLYHTLEPWISTPLAKKFFPLRF